MSFAEQPQWLTRVQQANLSARAAIATNALTAGAETAGIEQSAIQKITRAFDAGDIDQKFLNVMFSYPEALLLAVMEMEHNAPLILRQRTFEEVCRQFPPVPNADGSRNIPIGMTAHIVSAPLYLDVDPAPRPAGPLWVNTAQQDEFIQAIAQSNRRLNARKIPILINPSNTQIGQLWQPYNNPMRRSIIIVQIEKAERNTLGKLIQISKDIPFHPTVFVYPPEKPIKPPPSSQELIYPSHAVYGIKRVPGTPDQKFFPIHL